MKAIEEFLRQTMGLHAPTIGSAMVQRAVRARMNGLGLSKPQDYLQLLQGSPDEWRELVEGVVVTETWFFRDRETFRALARLALNEWLPANPTGTIKLLSLPCSTGEEPYSMAMALLDAGVAAARFHIDAMDINGAAIARAQRAEYGKNSFRGKDLGFRARYFKAGEKSWALDERVRNLVHFQAGNILDGECLAQGGAYDFIFCRNLLIYFDGPTQERTVRKLNGLLSAKGVLFVGSAEAPIAVRNGFISARLPLSFACRKAPAKRILPSTPLPAIAPGHEGAAISSPARRLPQAVSSADLATARKLANEGRLEEAQRICEAYLRAGGVSAEAYYLLGLVNDAAGSESQASEFYRKALYLEPNHYETLLQWASLSEKTGDGAHARILNERAERIKETELE